jgi:hypothetical protein
MQRLVTLTLFAAIIFSVNAEAGEWSGNAALEWRGFAHTALDPRQHGNNFAVSFQPEYYHEWDNGAQSFTLEPFIRVDEHDSERSHADIRALNWVYVADEWELRAGIGRVFWGVTESAHLVDVINQTDAIENLDGEDKLGQPMIKFSVVRDWGTLDAFLLPGSRERTYPGKAGRLRQPLVVDNDLASYASSRGRDHLDAAIRWSKAVGDWDMALSHFSGTTREPILQPVITAVGAVVLAPHYDVIDQTGIELQSTQDALLWKFELISRSGQGHRFTAAAGGFEYTFYGVFEGNTDVGVLAEYLYDDRGEAGAIFENDLFLGMRIALNDVNSSELLAGVIQDLDSSTRLFSLEASRRFAANWRLSLESHWFIDVPPNESLYSLRNDDYIQAELAYYF